MLGHLENVNSAAVGQRKPHIVANRNVFGVLVPKYATITLFLMGYCPLEHWKKIGPKKKKALFYGKSSKSILFRHQSARKP